MYFWSAVYAADLGSSIANNFQADDCRGNSPAVNPNTRYAFVESVCLFCRQPSPSIFSSSSPCSSGYATPQQTALTDSMVDTLAWKNLNIKSGVRNSMEDSTDTLVDDGKVTWIYLDMFAN